MSNNIILCPLEHHSASVYNKTSAWKNKTYTGFLVNVLIIE